MPTALPADRLLEARELGACLHPLDRALVLLRLAQGDAAGEPAELPLVERDARLLALRRDTFGDTMACVADCPRCGDTTEFDLSATTLLASLAAVSPNETLRIEDCWVTLRALDSRDLAHVAQAPDAARAADALVRRAVVHVAAPSGCAEPTAAIWQAVEARVAEREAAADTVIELVCPACRFGWTEAFDIGAHLWTELDVAARRLLEEVVLLARLFGWSESQILALSPARRRAYLQIAGQIA